MYGTTLSHHRVTANPGRVSAQSRARSLGYARDKLREAEGSLPLSGWLQ
jgi:hypothetical protein